MSFILASSNADEFEGKDSMNGISMRDFKDFEKKWKLVTVRYRKDTEEMRWTFANDIAWESLISGKISYPEGAIFAKIGIRTLPDAQFQSSAVPMGARRYQFMVRDSKKYGSTDGWGYALFDVNGVTYPENPQSVAQACHACHKIVENRGYVFSQVFEIAPFVKFQSLSGSPHSAQIEFINAKSQDLPEVVKKQLPSSFKNVRLLKNEELHQSVFQGTLDEIKPSLEREAYDSKLPAIFIDKSKKRFSIVFKNEMTGCKPGRSFKSVSTKIDGSLIVNEYCNP